MTKNESVVPNDVPAFREPETTQSELVPARFKENKELPSTFFDFGKGVELNIGSEAFLSFFVNVKLKLVTPFGGPKAEDPESGSLKLWEEFEDVHAAPLYQVPIKDKVAAFRLCLEGEALKSVTAFPYPTNNLGYLELIEYFFVRYGGADSECWRLYFLAARAVPRSVTDKGRIRYLEWLVGTCKLWEKYVGCGTFLLPPMLYHQIYIALPKNRVTYFLCEKESFPGIEGKMSGEDLLKMNPAAAFQAALNYMAGFRTNRGSITRCPSRDYEDDEDEVEGSAVVFVDNDSLQESFEKITNSAVCCEFCYSVRHDIFECTLSVKDKREKIFESGRCLNCLEKGHVVKACRNKMRCTIDGRKHHSSVCSKQQ